jgi:hypothetical protein
MEVGDGDPLRTTRLVSWEGNANANATKRSRSCVQLVQRTALMGLGCQACDPQH